MSNNPDPSLDEIQARLDVHVKCTDCGKCRVSVTEEWCPECDYWACEGGLACADDPYPADVRYLLAELRKAREALAAIDVVPPISHGIDADARFANGYNEALRRVRAAVAAAKGDGG
jgi:hypothetical protein